MKKQLKITGIDNQVYAVIVLTNKIGDRYFGKIEKKLFPEKLLELFRKFEIYVNSQLLSHIDLIQDEFEVWELKIGNHKIFDVQVTNDTDIVFQMNKEI